MTLEEEFIMEIILFSFSFKNSFVQCPELRRSEHIKFTAWMRTVLSHGKREERKSKLRGRHAQKTFGTEKEEVSEKFR
jgi:hypothetical protein